jgi:hypothetical protein
MVRTREDTNKQTIALLRNMMETMKPAKSRSSVADNAIALGLDLQQMIKTMEPERALIFTRELLGMDD